MNNGAFVFSTALVQKMKELVSYHMDGDSYTCDIHEDNTRVISG